MTRTSLIISLLFLPFLGGIMQAENSDIKNYQIQAEKMQADTLLVNIQSKIYDAFVKSLRAGDNNSLKKLSKELETLNKSKNSKLVLYWRSYLQFYSSIYYLTTGDKDAAEEEIDKGVDWLDDMQNKNSEDYALLAMLQGFGIQFKGMKAMFIAGSIEENVQKAMKIDPENIRGYYVYGSNDFHKPARYGGGKKAEQYLLKAISLPAQKVKNPRLPSWGKEDAYELLIRLYIKQKKMDLAKKYFQEGMKMFPKSYMIKKFASQL